MYNITYAYIQSQETTLFTSLPLFSSLSLSSLSFFLALSLSFSLFLYLTLSHSFSISEPPFNQFCKLHSFSILLGLSFCLKLIYIYFGKQRYDYFCVDSPDYRICYHTYALYQNLFLQCFLTARILLRFSKSNSHLFINDSH